MPLSLLETLRPLPRLRHDLARFHTFQPPDIGKVLEA